jgi:hypothetical protein
MFEYRENCATLRELRDTRGEERRAVRRRGGTHEDTLMSPAGEITPTHKTLNGRAVQIFRVDGDTIAATRLYFDQVQVMTQLGLMPEPAAA